MQVEGGRDVVVKVAGAPLMAVGTGAARRVHALLMGEGFDAVLADSVVYGIAEGFSREAGNEPGNPRRFHDGLGRHAGADLPEGLDADTLADRARDAMSDADILEGKTVAEIEEIALLIGADAYRERMPSP